MSTELLTIRQVCARLPGARGASHIHPATVVRWILSGCPGRDGRRVRLAATRCGSRWLVTPADLDAFFAALAGVGDDPAPHTPAAASDRDYDRRAAAAAKRLIEQGA